MCLFFCEKVAKLADFSWYEEDVIARGEVGFARVGGGIARVQVGGGRVKAGLVEKFFHDSF